MVAFSDISMVIFIFHSMFLELIRIIYIYIYSYGNNVLKHWLIDNLHGFFQELKWAKTLTGAGDYQLQQL